MNHPFLFFHEYNFPFMIPTLRTVLSIITSILFTRQKKNALLILTGDNMDISDSVSPKEVRV